MSLIPAGYALQFDTVFSAMDFTSAGLGTGLTYRVGFYKRGYSGTVTRLKAASTSPVTADMTGDSIFGQKPRTAKVRIIATATVSLFAFYAASDRDMFVSIDVIHPVTDAFISTYFAGWASTFDSREPYQHTPYPIEISISDGLSSLSDYPFLLYPDGQPPANTFSRIYALQMALRWTGYFAPVWTNYHTAEESDWTTNAFGIPQHPGNQYDFLSHTSTPVTRWQNEDGTFWTCKQVIDDILGICCRLVQVNGAWVLDYLPDLPGTLDTDGTYKRYYNTYSYNGLTTATGFAVLSSGKTLYKTKEAIPLMGSQLGILQPILRYKLEYSYGPKPSVLTNGAMLGSPGTTPAGWTPHFFNPASGKIVGGQDADSPYAVRIYDLKNGDTKRTFQTDFRHDSYLEQSVILPIAPGEKKKLIISGNYANHNTGGSAIQVIITFGFINPQGQFVSNPPLNGLAYFFLQSDGGWKNAKSGGAFDLYLHDLNLTPDGSQGGKDFFQGPAGPVSETFSHTTQEIPNNFLYANLYTVLKVTIQLLSGPDYNSKTPHATVGDNCYTDYWNIKLQQGDASLVDLDKEVIYAEVAGLSVTDRKKTQDLAIVSGYQTTAYGNPPKALRPGALLKNDGVTKIGRGLTLSGHIDKPQNLDLRGRLEFTRRPRKLADVEVISDVTPGDMLIGQEIGGAYFLLATHAQDLRMRTVKARAQEMPNLIDKLQDAIFSGNYLTSDGAIYPMREGVQATAPVGTIPAIPNPRLGNIPLPPDLVKILKPLTGSTPAGAVTVATLLPPELGQDPPLYSGGVLSADLQQL